MHTHVYTRIPTNTHTCNNLHTLIHMHTYTYIYIHTIYTPVVVAPTLPNKWKKQYACIKLININNINALIIIIILPLCVTISFIINSSNLGSVYMICHIQYMIVPKKPRM